MKKALVALATLTFSVLVASGGASASVSCAPGTAPAPSVVTDHETDVTLTSATFHGKVDPHGCPTTYRFEYGTTTAYGTVTSQTAAGSGTSSVLVSAAITGLAPHTVYHFRVVASSAAGTTDGSDVMFRTRRACILNGGSRPPAAVTDHATAALATSATLQGKVDPHGCPTTYRFEYGTTVAYGKVTQAAEAGSGTRSVLAMAPISRLAPDTVYHYRIVATSGAGTTAGRDETLKTSTATSSLVIVGQRFLVKRGFSTRIHLRCTPGSAPCQGVLTILLRHRSIGRQHYLLAPNSASVVSVHLNRRGRGAVRSHRRVRVELLAASGSGRARALGQLIRRFRTGV